ncbi:MAG: hypothetical protein HYW65_04865, partial [Candidatus Liptonbacteria bacterium]|nr:hypothetical protein [Candidatus Liptonbacteria bacterium]
MQERTLFPPSYLAKGSQDLIPMGPVRWLQMWLISLGANGIVANGTYDDATAAWVTKLQEKYSAANREGNLGLEIRKLMAMKNGVDVSRISIPPNLSAGPVVYYAEVSGLRELSCWFFSHRSLQMGEDDGHECFLLPEPQPSVPPQPLRKGGIH